MKKIWFLLWIVFYPFSLNAEDLLFDFGNFNFFLSPKIMKDGSITEIGLGLMYTDIAGGIIRFRNTSVAKNEELSNVSDSLNSATEKKYEFHLNLIDFYFQKTEVFFLRLGAGFYYDYNKLSEKGFFNMPLLEAMIPPREQVNSYTNNFSMHLLGPLAEAGISYKSRLFGISISGGIVPVFFLHTNQKTGIVPLMEPNMVEFSQNTWGKPYCYLNLDCVLFKFINLTFLYDYTRLKYSVVDFDENLDWIRPFRTVVTQSFKIEASALLPLGDSTYGQIGYGHTFDSTRLDSLSVDSNRNYIIFTVKKIGN